MPAPQEPKAFPLRKAAALPSSPEASPPVDRVLPEVLSQRAASPRVDLGAPPPAAPNHGSQAPEPTGLPKVAALQPFQVARAHELQAPRREVARPKHWGAQAPAPLALREALSPKEAARQSSPEAPAPAFLAPRAFPWPKAAEPPSSQAARPLVDRPPPEFPSQKAAVPPSFQAGPPPAAQALRSQVAALPPYLEAPGHAVRVPPADLFRKAFVLPAPPEARGSGSQARHVRSHLMAACSPFRAAPALQRHAEAERPASREAPPHMQRERQGHPLGAPPSCPASPAPSPREQRVLRCPALRTTRPHQSRKAAEPPTSPAARPPVSRTPQEDPPQEESAPPAFPEAQAQVLPAETRVSRPSPEARHGPPPRQLALPQASRWAPPLPMPERHLHAAPQGPAAVPRHHPWTQRPRAVHPQRPPARRRPPR